MYKGVDIVEVHTPWRQKPMFGRLPKLHSLQAKFGVGSKGSVLQVTVLNEDLRLSALASERRLGVRGIEHGLMA